ADLRLPPHRPSLQRQNRERPHAHRKDPKTSPRIPKHRQLPAPHHRTSRPQMAYSARPPNTRPPTTVHRVAPLMSSQSRVAMADREDQYNSHPVWGHLDRIDARLEETEARLGDAGADAVSAHARVRSVARYV